MITITLDSEMAESGDFPKIIYGCTPEMVLFIELLGMIGRELAVSRTEPTGVFLPLGRMERIG